MHKGPFLQQVAMSTISRHTGSTFYQQSEGRLKGQVIGDTAGEKQVHPIEAFAIGWLVMPFKFFKNCLILAFISSIANPKILGKKC